MKFNNQIIELLIISVSLLFITNCKKETLNTIPDLNTNSVSVILKNTAVCGGSVTSNGGQSITKLGVCWSLSPSPTISDNITSDMADGDNFTSNIDNLIPNTKYYIRAYATNSNGTAYGNEVSFITTETNIFFNPNVSYESLTDYDGNVYKTVVIGTQTWMAENLRTTTLNDGTPISNVIDQSIWGSLQTPAYCYQNNTTDVDSILTFGSLYNWYTVNTGKLAPAGWHVPTEEEFETLIHYVGDNHHLSDDYAAGFRLREGGTVHWQFAYNTTTYNETGFTVLPAGFRSSTQYASLRYTGSFWCSTVDSNYYNSGRKYTFSDADNNIEDGYCYKYCGISIRCIKD